MDVLEWLEKEHAARVALRSKAIAEDSLRTVMAVTPHDAISFHLWEAIKEIKKLREQQAAYARVLRARGFAVVGGELACPLSERACQATAESGLSLRSSA